MNPFLRSALAWVFAVVFVDNRVSGDVLLQAGQLLDEPAAAQIWRWSLHPGRVNAGTQTPVTIYGNHFPPEQNALKLSVVGEPDITFGNLVVRDENTVTAVLSVPGSVKEGNFILRLDVLGDAPSGEIKSTAIAGALTVVDPRPDADLVDIGPAVGLPGADGLSASFLADDFNQDSFSDLLFVTHSQNPELLLLGDGRSFLPQPIMFPADRHSCDSADVNGDGLIDIYCSVGSDRGTGQGENNLWLRKSDGQFIDVAAQWGVTDKYGRGREVAFLHANDDQWPDLFVSNSDLRSDDNVSSNRLFINHKGKFFLPAPEYGVDSQQRSTCALAVDFNGDGRDDIVVCGTKHLHMFQNQNGEGFVEVSARYGLKRYIMDVDFADIDGDGDLDIAFVAPKKAEIRRLQAEPDQNAQRSESVFSMPMDSGRSVVFGDVNGDKLPDAFFVQKGCRTKLEKNLPDFLALNTGEAFRVLHPPAIDRGCGDAITAFDHDGDGRDGFVVANGHRRPGPIQYLVLPENDDGD